MKKYCRAYQLKDLRRFQHWKELVNDCEEELTDDEIVYLWDDFSVVKSPVAADSVPLFAQNTPEWRTFCRTVLQFDIPEDLRSAYQTAEPVATSAATEASV